LYKCSNWVKYIIYSYTYFEHMSDINYIIYCRKSTDESSDNQKQSIPDQIRACVSYAEREGLTIVSKPKDFSLFESESEVYKEDNEADLVNRKTFQDTRHLFIIKEQETAKVPWKRTKWKNLIKKVKSWEINGIISYSPDRQARNMLEAWDIIDLLDQNKLKINREQSKTVLSVKYPNFHYEDTASGKMMLWIWFVFSKQYSDKLSDDITRWNDSKVASWKAIGRHKPWYFQNEDGFHEPHAEYFPLIKEAFDMKLNWEVESKIKDFLDANWYTRYYIKAWEERPISKTMLNKMFQDEFYYGMFINWDTVTDLRETNKYYSPVITEEQFQVLQERYYKNPTVIKKSRTKDIYEDIKVFDIDFIKTEDNYGFTFSLPNKKRYFDKIDEANKKWKLLKLQDVVSPSQINYRCANTASKSHKLSVSLEDIDNKIIDVLWGFKVSKKQFDEYVVTINTKLEDITLTTKDKIQKKQVEIGRIKTRKEKYIQANMSKITDNEERSIYEATRNDYDSKIKFLRKEIEALDEWERNEIVELEVFIDILNNAQSYYKKASYVQKRKIAKLLFLNIQINSKKELQIQVKPEVETLFNPIWWS